MSDMSQGIDLDFGATDAIVGSEPIPDGVYILRVDDATVVPTKDGNNNMIKCMFRVACPDDHPLAKFNGRGVIDNWFLPNPATQTPEAVQITKGYLCGKLEIVTGEWWEHQQRRLVPRELVGRKFKALVSKVDEGYGPQNRVTRYIRLDAETELGFTAPAAPRPPNGGGRGAAPVGGETAPTGKAPERFRI